VYLARVIGRLVATECYEGLEAVPFQWVQPLDEEGRDSGAALVACAAISSGPGDLVHFVDGREAALACPETFVPVDATIIGFVEQATSLGRDLAAEHPRSAEAR
jgi:microcompartment protein CcmK/EutM